MLTACLVAWHNLIFLWGTFVEGKQAIQSIRGAGSTDLLFLMSVVKVSGILYITIADLYVPLGLCVSQTEIN